MTVHFFVEPDEPNKEDLQVLFDNLSLFQRYKKLIYNTPDYYNIRIKGCGCFPLYSSPFRLSIGELLKLWDETEWRQEDKYFYSITGSPLSGGNYSEYWSKTGFENMQTRVFTKQMISALWFLQTGSPEIKSPYTSSVVPERDISRLTITDLVNILKNIYP